MANYQGALFEAGKIFGAVVPAGWYELYIDALQKYVEGIEIHAQMDKKVPAGVFIRIDVPYTGMVGNKYEKKISDFTDLFFKKWGIERVKNVQSIQPK